MTSPASIYSTELSVVAVLSDVSLLETPKAESFGKHQINSVLDVKILELTAVKEFVFSTAFWT